MICKASIRKVTLLMLANLLVPWGVAEAHGVWVAQRTGEWALVLGEGGVDDSYKASAIKSVQGQAGNGTSSAVGTRTQELNVVLTPSSDVATVAVSFEDGYWSEDSAGKWHEGSRLKFPEAKTAGFYQMFTRAALAPSSMPSKPFGLPLEILPQADPLRLKQGESLRLQVLFDGKPLANVKVVSDYLSDNVSSVTTDEKGYAEIKVRSTGLNVVKVSHNVQRKDRREVDEDGYVSTLAFSLPQD